jgi:hypothetical protein
MRKLLIALSILTLSLPTFACNEAGTTGIVEDNDLQIHVGAKSANKTMTEEVFNSVIDGIQTIYAPLIDEMGGKLQVVRKWEDATVNAYAQRSGNTYKVSMFGGLARHETITADGFALVLCHEIGHHIGGAPKKKSSWSTSWASNEGQADYFATLKCLRKAWLADDNAAAVSAMEVPAALKNTCKAANETSQEDYFLCVRGAMAGLSVSKLFSNLRRIEDPQFITPDSTSVSRTNHSHPAPQCRLDTYYQGALCTVNHNDEVSQTDESTSVCYRKSGDTDGVRPLCWFKPKA